MATEAWGASHIAENYPIGRFARKSLRDIAGLYLINSRMPRWKPDLQL